jgi:hypothetical protein
MKIRTKVILNFLRLLALLACIGFVVEGTSILISFIVSFFNPVAAKNLYNRLDLHELKDYANWAYYTAAAFLILIAGLKASVWLKALNMLSHLNIENPFKPQMIKLLEAISYILIVVWVIALLYNILGRYILKETGHELLQPIDPGSFLFMAGLVFVISQVFKRGIEMQSENELTV